MSATQIGWSGSLYVGGAVLGALLFGRMADEVLLASQRVVPQRLQELGYRFACPTLAAALAAELGAG